MGPSGTVERLDRFSITAILLLVGEEHHLLATFPGRCDAYMQRTGRVLPKWS